MKIISRVGKTRLAGLWRSSKWIPAIIIPIISAIQLAGLSIGQPVKAQPATEQKGNDIVQLVHIPVIASHGSAEGQYMTPEDYEKQKNSPSYYEYTYKDTDYAGTVMALTRDGRLFTWGSNIGGNVGMGVDCPTVNNDKTTTIIRRPPCYYSEPQDITKYFGGEKIAKITRSNYTSIAITESGKVYQWGWKYYQHQNSGHYQKTHNKPTINQDLAPHRITGLNGGRGDYHGAGGWLAFNRSSVYFKSDPSILSAYKDDHGMAGDTDSQTFPHLDSDITDVDYVRRPTGNYDGWNHRKSRIYLLTANHKLLQVEGDKITEITNDTIAKRGGFRQISQQYAIDMKGGLWFYGNSSDDGPIYDMSARSAKPMPAIDSFTGGGPVMRSGNKFYGLKHLVSWLCGDNVSCGFEPVDVTTLISKQPVSLFSGDIRLNDVFNNSDKIYDYSFVPQDRPNTICTALSGVAYENTIEQESTVIHLPHQTTQPVDGTLPATCVSIPDPVKPPTPTNPTPTPGVPGTPKLPGVPNTGLRDDKVVQLVHSPATFDYYGKVKMGNMETWRDQDYAGTTVVLTESGKLYAWGNNIAGGVGNDTDYGATFNKKPPVYYSDPQDITRFFNGDKIVKLVNHRDTFAAITSSGKVYYWGHRLSDKDKKPIIHPVTLSELSPYHIIGFGRDIDPSNGNGLSSYVASHPDNMSDYLAFSKDTIFALNYDLDTSQLQYHDEAKNRIKPRLSSGVTILDVDHIKHRTPTAEEPEPDKGGYYTLTSDHKLLRVLEDGTTSEITNSEIKKRGGVKQLSYAGHYAIDRQGGLWYYGYREGNDSIHDMTKISTSGKLPHLDSFFNVLGPVARGADGAIYAITDTHINRPGQYFVGRSVDPIDVGTLLGGKQKIKLLSGEVETRYRGDSGYTNDYYPPKDLPFYDFAFVPQSQPDTICVGLSGAAYNRIIGENQGPRFETIQPVDGTIPSTCVKLPPWDDGKPNPSPVPGAPTTPKAPGVPNTGSQPDPIVQLVHIPAVINGAINGNSENLTAKDTDYAGTVMVLTQSGRVFAWGNNYAGSVGVGTAGFKVPYPESVKSRREGRPEYYDTPQEITKYFGDDKVVRIGRYGRTSVAVTQSGKLYQWGWSYNPPWDWYDRLKNITWTEPTPDPTPSFNKVTGMGGSYGDTYSGGGWLAHGDDTIFTKTSTSQLKDFGDKLKLSLNGATIRSVDYVDFNGRVAQVAQQRPQDLDQSFRTGVYILTSTNKLLRVKNDGTTTEVTNDKIKSRGGIRQIANQYAIDNQGGLWYYGVSMNKDQIYDMSLKTLGGITPLPRLRDIVGIDLIEDEHMLDDLQRPWSSSVLVRSIDGHIYDVSPVQTGFSVEDGGYPERRFALTDVTKLLGHDKIKLFDGKIHSTGDTKLVDNEAPGLYDYSYVPESKLDTVCTVISGVASANASQAQSLYGHGHPLNVSVTTTKLVNGAFAPTCVKLPPLLTPDPKPSPTPNPKPTKPTSGIKVPFDRSKAPGVPSTGSEPLFTDGYQTPIFARH